MKIISINAGSSSLKFTLFEFPEKEVIASGTFEKIGIEGSFYTIKYNGEKIRKEVELKNHTVAVNFLLTDLLDLKIVNSLDEIEGVGHRMLHGGSECTKPMILDEKKANYILENYGELGPLHTPANVAGVKAFIEALPEAIQVGVFDTSFHQTMDKENYLYPVPFEWYTEFGVRKYGFHGTSHRFVYKEICEKLDNPNLKAITCHIGNGGSVTAIDAGKVVDTSMGFTPEAGIMMGTRAGDIDPTILEFICNKTGKSISEVTNDLNKKSGLLGISGVSSDARDVENAALEGNERAVLAEEMYAQRVANYIVMYANKLGGTPDVIVFTAGLGENSAHMRKLIVDRLPLLNVELDKEANDMRGEFKLISSEQSEIPIFVIPTNEELMIAEDTLELKEQKEKGIL